MTGDEIVALSKKHTITEYAPQDAVNPIPVAQGEGRLLLDAGRQAVHRLQQPADVGEHRPRRSAGHRRDHRAGGEGHLRHAVDDDRGAGAARREAGRDHPGRHRRVLLHQRRRRGQRERLQDRPRRHRPPEDPGALPLVSRRHRRGDCRHRRSARLEPAADARHRARARPVSRRGARLGRRGHVAAVPRGSDPARGAAHDRRVHPRDRHRHQRHARAARRLHAGRAGAVRQARHPDDCRRGDERLRPHRQVVRDRALGRGARHDHDGQGADQLVHPARRRRRPAAARRSLQGQDVSRAG